MTPELANLIATCIEAVIYADNGDYYESGMARADKIEEALKEIGVEFGPETAMMRYDERPAHRQVTTHPFANLNIEHVEYQNVRVTIDPA